MIFYTDKITDHSVESERVVRARFIRNLTSIFCILIPVSFFIFHDIVGNGIVNLVFLIWFTLCWICFNQVSFLQRLNNGKFASEEAVMQWKRRYYVEIENKGLTISRPIVRGAYGLYDNLEYKEAPENSDLWYGEVYVDYDEISYVELKAYEKGHIRRRRGSSTPSEVAREQSRQEILEEDMLENLERLTLHIVLKEMCQIKYPEFVKIFGQKSEETFPISYEIDINNFGEELYESLKTQFTRQGIPLGEPDFLDDNIIRQSQQSAKVYLQQKDFLYDNKENILFG